MPTERKERRTHARQQATDTEISVWNSHGDLEPIESTNLKDISGGGAQFASTHIEEYTIGQALRLDILLPGCGGEKKKIECWACVIWVNDQAEPSVSVAMDYILSAAQIKLLTPSSEMPE